MLTELEKRCVEISYQHKLTHVSSVLNTVEVIAKIYRDRAENDPFVLGNSHASLALFVVLEKQGICDAVEMMLKHGTHASRDMEYGVWVSGGSLGQAETVAVGLAIADPKHTVWLVTSDGACAEGSVWEAMRIAEPLNNLKVDVIYNGHGAYGKTDARQVLAATNRRATIREVRYWRYPKWLQGLPGHYLTLSYEQYSELMV